MPHLHHGQGRLGPRAVPGPRRPRRLRRRVRRAGKDLRARLFELLPQDECELFGIGDAAQARELRGQLQVLRDQALIFAIEEQADLPQRVDIALVRELHHRHPHLIIGHDPVQVKSA